MTTATIHVEIPDSPDDDPDDPRPIAESYKLALALNAYYAKERAANSGFVELNAKAFARLLGAMGGLQDAAFWREVQQELGDDPFGLDHIRYCLSDEVEDEPDKEDDDAAA